MKNNCVIKFSGILLALFVFSKAEVQANVEQDSKVSDYAEKGYLTFDNKPLGSLNRPLVLRTFVPTLELSKESVLYNHSSGSTSPKYSPGSGKESTSEYKPIDGIPAAIAVNLGKNYPMFGTLPNVAFFTHGQMAFLIW